MCNLRNIGMFKKYLPRPVSISKVLTYEATLPDLVTEKSPMEGKKKNQNQNKLSFRIRLGSQNIPLNSTKITAEPSLKDISTAICLCLTKTQY